MFKTVGLASSKNHYTPRDSIVVLKKIFVQMQEKKIKPIKSSTHSSLPALSPTSIESIKKIKRRN